MIGRLTLQTLPQDLWDSMIDVEELQYCEFMADLRRFVGAESAAQIERSAESTLTLLSEAMPTLQAMWTAQPEVFKRHDDRHDAITGLRGALILAIELHDLFYPDRDCGVTKEQAHAFGRPLSLLTQAGEHTRSPHKQHTLWILDSRFTTPYRRAKVLGEELQRGDSEDTLVLSKAYFVSTRRLIKEQVPVYQNYATAAIKALAKQRHLPGHGAPLAMAVNSLQEATRLISAFGGTADHLLEQRLGTQVLASRLLVPRSRSVVAGLGAAVHEVIEEIDSAQVERLPVAVETLRDSYIHGLLVSSSRSSAPTGLTHGLMAG